MRPLQTRDLKTDNLSLVLEIFMCIVNFHLHDLFDGLFSLPFINCL